MRKPMNILSIGFTLLLFASVALAFAQESTPHLWIELPMAATGIGLGFILNNMNIFGQEIAGRERFGITTALLQSTRMVGGMLGTSIVGTIVAHHYANVVERTMQRARRAGGVAVAAAFRRSAHSRRRSVARDAPRRTERRPASMRPRSSTPPATRSCSRSTSA